ncbi:hypothetical protein NUH87_06105 [Pseudomonas batumici]|uniref:hypothetical protein n=1 Tax=Pseudomonas batumici TaxID=226910 RepID=UPI0030D5E071
MDATFHRFSCFPLLALTLALSGCQTTGLGSSTPPAISPGLEVFNAVLKETPEPSSIVREGERITYVVRTPPGREHRYLASFDTDCSKPTVEMVFLTTRGMVSFSDGPNTRPEELGQIPVEQKKQYLQSAQLKQVCAQTAPPDWRAFATPNHQDWQLIDRASLKVKGDEVTFWSARVPASETLLPDKEALYSQSRQRWTANCSLQQLALLSAFYLGPKGLVIGGEIQAKPAPKGQGSLDADERQLLQLACGKPQSLEQYAHYEGREQSPFKLPVPAIAPSIVKAIEALNMPRPEKSIQHLQLVFNDLAQANRPGLYGLGRLGSDTSYPSSETGKMLVERGQGSLNQEVKVSFRGLITLGKSNFNTSANGFSVKERSPATNLKFEGDWATMPVGAQLRYTLEIPFVFDENLQIPKDYGFTCNVESQRPASAYYPSLTGNAKVLNCTGWDYQWGQGIGTFAYLEAYGLFVPVEYVANSPSKWYGKWTIKAVE